MIAGFDVRTLALTNLLLAIILGLGVLFFSRVHPNFKGFRQVGYSLLMLGFGFLLLTFRDHIPNWLSIIAANAIIVLSYCTLGCGLFYFFKAPIKSFISITIAVQMLLIPSLIYLCYFNESVNGRIILMSLVLSSIYIFIAQNLKSKQEKHYRFLIIIRYYFLFCALFFIFRALWTLSEAHLDSYMNAGVVHGLSLITLQILTIVISFAISWTASDRLAHSLVIQATIDPLTNIYNRRALEDFAEKALAQAKREQQNLVVIIMDIDDFKEVNDDYGHQAGDQVLISFSQRLKDNLREYDTLARYGGEEFILLLPNTEMEVAQTIAEKLRLAIEAPVFLIKNNLKITVTASFGIAIGQGELLDWQQLVFQADNALYQAKSDGKNKVHLHHGDILVFDRVKN